MVGVTVGENEGLVETVGAGVVVGACVFLGFLVLLSGASRGQDGGLTLSGMVVRACHGVSGSIQSAATGVVPSKAMRHKVTWDIRGMVVV